MTAKRFYLLNYNNYPIYDSLNDKEYNAQFKAQREKLCLLLNELYEENEQLKKQLIGCIGQLIDNKIDEFKNGDYGDLPCNTIHMFLDLKQEMRDLE